MIEDELRSEISDLEDRIVELEDLLNEALSDKEWEEKLINLFLNKDGK